MANEFDVVVRLVGYKTYRVKAQDKTEAGHKAAELANGDSTEVRISDLDNAIQHVYYAGDPFD